MSTFDAFPDVVRIEPAGICNHQCTFCPVGVEGGRRGLMPYRDFVRIFDRLPFVPRVLVLYHGGEPTLNNDLVYMIDYASVMGVHRIILNTNGSNLDANTDFSNLDEMRVSFAGNSAEEHNAIRLGSDFERDAEAILELAHSKNRPRQIIILSVTEDGRVADYLMDHFASNGCETGIVFEGLKRKEWARPTNIAGNVKDKRYCRNLFETITILSNGDVCLCNDDLMGEMLFGNALETSPLDVWRRMQPVRDQFRSGYYPLMCRSCWVLCE